jgi:hypothetical protein
MRVVAIAPGFYDGGRKRVGDTFEADIETFKVDGAGNPVMPSWMAAATDEVTIAKAKVKRDKPIFSHHQQSKKVTDQLLGKNRK